MDRPNHSMKEQFDEYIKNYYLQPYTWVYRWNKEKEFTWEESLTISKSKETLRHANTSQANYFVNILSRHPSIVVYHKESISEVKHCHDKSHFHVISWHKQHPCNLHSFQMLKNILNNNIEKPYTLKAMKVLNPYGFCQYLTQDNTIRWVVCADNVNNEREKTLLQQLTTKEILEEDSTENNSDTDFIKQASTVRGCKYDFIKKMMRKCNSTDKTLLK